MIPRLDSVVDLGRDQKRMSDEDPRRQPDSVNKILDVFFGPLESRTEIQLLADEVGMGKTFVALATAYAILDMVRHKPLDEQSPDLKKCYGAVLVVTPAGNHALTEKWHREVEAFRTRCSQNEDSTRWFHSKICNTLEDLVESLCRAHDRRRDPTKAPCVIVCQGNIFTRRLQDAGERLRFLAACLFRWWGNKLNKKERCHIVRWAAKVRGFSNWEGKAYVVKGEYEVDLWDFCEHETYLNPSSRSKWNWPSDLQSTYEQIPFEYADIEKALDKYVLTQDGREFFYDPSERLRKGHAESRGLLPYCKSISTRKGNAELYFSGFTDRLLDLYRELIPTLLKNKKLFFPLVIADEAHHWRNSQRKDCQAFRKYLAPLSRRLLLLTATPFQLHREELLEVLATGDSMEPAIGADRVELLKKRCLKLAEGMNSSEKAGQSFSREWGVLAEQIARMDSTFSVTTGELFFEDDSRTREIERQWAMLRCESGNKRQEALQNVPGPLRPFFTKAVQLLEANLRLHEVMSLLIIRHRRQTNHRRYWVGREYPTDVNSQVIRPDRSQLHLALGRPMPPEAELAQYLLMKVVAEMSRGKHRTTLGMDLTGCYTTLWKSREGSKAVETALQSRKNSVLTILKKITGHGPKHNPRDAEHPKVKTVVAEVLRRWDEGEKSLIFCFRVSTADTLYRLLSKGVDDRLRAAREALFVSRGTDTKKDIESSNKAMQQFRRSLTAREGSGLPLFLDRILFGWFEEIGKPLQPELIKDDVIALARLCARAVHNNRPLYTDFDRPDRVFLSRAIEHVLAKRIRGIDLTGLLPDKRGFTEGLLDQIASEDWVRYRYGNHQLGVGRGGNSEDESKRSEHLAKTSLSAVYDLTPEPDFGLEEIAMRALKVEAIGIRTRILETLLSGPNLFLPLGKASHLIDASGHERSQRMRKIIFDISLKGGNWNWLQRAQILDAVVRAFLREDILLRLPKEVFQGADETWSESLLRGYHMAPSSSHQLEPVAVRVEEFLSELSEMGVEEREAHFRYAMNSKAESVVLVTGSNKVDRDAVFSGFNTPLLPDILVCTQVGQEGIDLHRHCRHVIHYDLGWNPAAIEQRTGRTDRIGSKAMRERNIKLKANGQLPEDQLPGLDIAMPYLAGTYDERMFERLRTRAQVFDILTGGDPTADQESCILWLNPDNEGEDDGKSFVPLPRQMLDDLRLNLSVKITSTPEKPA